MMYCGFQPLFLHGFFLLLIMVLFTTVYLLAEFLMIYDFIFDCFLTLFS